MASPYAWALKDGSFRRKLGSMELLYLTMASPEGKPVHWMIGSGVRLSCNDLPQTDAADSIRKAWQAVRHILPNIGAYVDPSTEEMVLPEVEDASSWTCKSFRVHEQVTSHELFSSSKSQYHISLHFVRDTREVILQAPHFLVDRRGIMQLFHVLFTNLAEQTVDIDQTFRPDPAALTKPYDLWLNIPDRFTEESFNLAQSIFAAFQQQKPVRLPGVDFAQHPRRPMHRELQMDKQISKMIIKACKAKGVSVTSACHAALVISTLKLQALAGETGDHYTEFTTFDLRRYFGSEFDARRDSIATLQTALPFTVDVREHSDFLTISRDLNCRYKAPFAFASNDFSYLNPYMVISRQLISSGAAPPSSTPAMSSIGVVDNLLKAVYGNWRVHDFWISSTFLTGGIQMYQWSFDEQLTLSVCYNEAFYDLAVVDRLLEMTRAEMLHGLAIDSDVAG